ncbi:MAG: protease inhibitor I42 family protein [Anaerolineaceae bacterium]
MPQPIIHNRKIGLFPAGLLLLSGLLLLQTACTGANPGSASKTIVLKQEGGQFTARPGDILEITLEANPSTGYIWEVDPLDEKILQLDGEPETRSGANANLVGAPVTQTFRFKAVAPGQATLTISYRRPWEKGIEPEKTYTAQITISQ